VKKLDFKKDFKELYNPSRGSFTFVELPAISYLMLDGAGDPNTAPEFQQSIETLYGTAYTLKFSLKKAGIGPEYSVAPLDGLWWCEGMEGFDPDNREIWRWTLMIAQPPHIKEEMLNTALSALVAKGKKGLWERIRLEVLNEGLCVQTLYIGPYCDEGPTIAAMHKFIEDEACSLRGRHHEIYMSDPRRTAPEKLKTILRHPVSR